jgi:N-acetylglucosamine-6-phosphate deacetylase
MKTPLMIDEHIHGAFGIDCNTADVDGILFLAKKLFEHGIGGFFPTLVTDSVENIKRQTHVIKTAAKECPNILGIHLEGIFINPEKKGIHNPEHFLPLTIENYKLLEDDFIKIITLAPELDEGLLDYLDLQNIKIQAGHCIGGDLSKVNGVTHLYNAMSGVTHRGATTALSALVNDKLYTEIIADGVHVSLDALKLLFKTKPSNKIILISDSLPITNSDMKETVFADSKIFYDGEKATSVSGTIAGSTSLLDKIVKFLASYNMFNPEWITNPYIYHNIKPFGEIVWDEDWNIVEIKKNK